MSEFSARRDGNEGYGARDDEKQEKAPALFRAGAVTTARSAGSFREGARRFSGQPKIPLTLFYPRRTKKAGVWGFPLTLFQKWRDLIEG